MNRTKVAIGLFLIAVLGLLGGRFGLPLLVERQVAAALDAHVAGLPDATGAGYAGLSLDYWNDQVRLQELRLPVDLTRPDGRPFTALVTVRDILVDGYDWPALEAAFQAGSASAGASPLVRQVTWGGVALKGQANGEPLGTVGAGTLDGLNAVAFSPEDGAVTSLGFDALSLRDMIMTPTPAYLGAVENTGQGAEIRVALPSVVVTGWGDEGADSIMLAGLAATAVADSGGVVELGFEELSLTDWRKGEPGKVGRVSVTGLSEMLQLPASVIAAQDPEVARMAGLQGPVRISVERYELSDLRYDPQLLSLWQSLMQVLEAQDEDGKPDLGILVGFLEDYLVILERARDLGTGIGSAELTGMQVSFGDASSMTLERLEISDMFGLKSGSFEVSGITQKVAGNVSGGIERYRGEIGDLSALPEWLRTVFGRPLAADSLAKARAWAEGKSLAELVPMVDLGTFSMEGLNAVGPDGKPVRMDLFAIDSMRIGEDASVELAFRLEGISAPLDSAAGRQPQAAMLLQMLKANGVEDLVLGGAIALRAGLADNTGALAVGISGADLAESRVEIDLTALDFEKLRQTPGPQRNMIALSSRLARAQLTVVDQGLRMLFLESQAAERPGATAEMIGTQFSAMAEQMGASMGTDASRAIGQQLAAFITQGGMLEVSTDLQTPLPIIQLMGLQRQPPASIIEALGISARHTAP
ncbi:MULTISPECIES: hypothetical protein [unclassified Minwuia]|jgi:hypothetical protein|uniref:hypothetical protein n=1 Tax=unclassified Minwuia TaxID=2618799 RepID=UPI00247B0E7B|nr:MULTISPECIES: hypothetical protein [unclassified Minwuia]